MSVGDSKKPKIMDYDFFTQTPVKTSKPLLQKYMNFGESASRHIARALQSELKFSTEVDLVSHGPQSLGEILAFQKGGMLQAFKQKEKDFVFIRFTPSICHRFLTVSLGGGEQKGNLSQPDRELTKTELNIISGFGQKIFEEIANDFKLQSLVKDECFERGELFLGGSPKQGIMTWEFLVNINGQGGCLAVVFDMNRVCEGHQ